MGARKLKAQMVLNGDTNEKLAKALGMSRNSLYLRMQGKSDFRAGEIKVISERYKLTPEQVDDIFFG